MSDLFGNHIVGFPTRRLKLCQQYALGMPTDYQYVLNMIYSSDDLLFIMI